MFLKDIKYYSLVTLALLLSAGASAQLGGPLLNITFGQGATGDLHIPGPALPTGFTEIPYTTDICPPPGSYAVVSGLNTECFNHIWIPLLSDNTPYPDNNGYMMLINDLASSTPKTIFRDTLKEPCNGVNYQFSAAIINVDDPAKGCVRFSNITLLVEDKTGNLIASTNTGDIQFAVYNMGYHFTKYVVDFMVPAGVSGIVVKIIDNPKSTADPCANAIAIDDIRIGVTGPRVSIGFDSTNLGDWVKSTCFQDNRAFTMYGSIDSGITNPAVHWQQSTDDGLNWIDIPGATGYSYTRSFSVPDTFLFRLRGSDSSLMNFPNCGVSSNLLKVQVNGLPTGYKVTNNSPLCAGQDLIFNVTGGASYMWWGPNGFTETAPYAHIYHSTLADSGRYYVKIFSPGGCYVTDSTRVIMVGVDVKLGKDTAVCKGQAVQLRASGGTSYQWTPAEGLSNPLSPNPRATPEKTTTYTLHVKNSIGCSNAGSITITVRNEIAAKAGMISPDYVCRSYDSVFFADNSLGKIVSWKWDFDNGQVSSSANPPMQYYSIANNASPYNIRLQVTDTAGCTDSIIHIIRIADNCYIAVPTGFTPNNDGLNDYLGPLNAYKASNLLFLVYNRSGQLVFKTRDWNMRWDGTFKGMKQEQGTYVWILRYNDAFGKMVEKKGTTVLIR